MARAAVPPSPRNAKIVAPMDSHPEFQLSMSSQPASPAGDPNRPSIGIMSFSGEVFDGTSLNLGDGKAYSKLKRCAPAPRASVPRRGIAWETRRAASPPRCLARQKH